jgi:hypothetical protein
MWFQNRPVDRRETQSQSCGLSGFVRVERPVACNQDIESSLFSGIEQVSVA